MSDVDSPIIDFYPRKFQLDMDGKKREWEAVINIPFIDENRLLDAMQRMFPPLLLVSLLIHCCSSQGVQAH